MQIFWTSVSHSHNSQTKSLPDYPKKNSNPAMSNLVSEDTDEAVVLSTSFASVFINMVSGSSMLRHKV